MNRTRGFTIIELMTVIAVLGVALAIGVPSFSGFLQDNRLVSHLNSLSSTLSLARSEAIKQNARVVVCGSTNGTACNAAGAWEKGWIAFVDRNADLAPDFPTSPTAGCAAGVSDDCLLAAEAAIPGAENVGNASGHLITVKGAPGIGNLIAYNGTGTARCDANLDGTLEACVDAATYFVICDRRGNAHARGVSISQTGRVGVIAASQFNGAALDCTAP